MLEHSQRRVKLSTYWPPWRLYSKLSSLWSSVLALGYELKVMIKKCQGVVANIHKYIKFMHLSHRRVRQILHNATLLRPETTL